MLMSCNNGLGDQKSELILNDLNIQNYIYMIPTHHYLANFMFARLHIYLHNGKRV